MRLLRKDGAFVAQFTMIWEVEFLAEKGDCWLPLYRLGQTVPLGQIHAQTYEICIFEGQIIAERQIVALGDVPCEYTA